MKQYQAGEPMTLLQLPNLLLRICIKEVAKFCLFSDNCFAQNKNRYYATMLWYCLQKFDLACIENKNLEKVTRSMRTTASTVSL